MNKILFFLMITNFYILHLFAYEPTLAMLQTVYSNSNQKFSLRQSHFMCKAYGVISVDELYQESKQNSACKKGIDAFYRQNPRAKYYSARLLKLRQMYHVEFKNNRCIIYAKGLNTLSELLLAQGLAIKKTIFKDEEFNQVFEKAQIEAKENNLGMYKNKIKYKCIAELFAIEQKNP